MSAFPVRIYGVVPSVLQVRLLPVVAQVLVVRAPLGLLRQVVAPYHAARVLLGRLHRRKVKVVVRLVPLVYLANMCIVPVIYKAIHFVWDVPLLRIVP